MSTWSLSDPIVSALGLAGMAVIGHFLRRCISQVDETGKDVRILRADVERRFSEVERKIEHESKETRKELTEAFREMCSERQISCGRLRDAKLAAVEARMKKEK